MFSSTVAAAGVLAAIALPAVNAHGYVENAIVGGQTVFVGNPQWLYDPTRQAAEWHAMDQDNGFVSPSEYQNPDIICHKNATPGTTYLTVAAGSTIGLQWNTWPDSHKGPVNNDLAFVSGGTGDFSTVDKTKLNFFRAQSTQPLVNDSPPPGTWQTDVLIANNFTGNFKIPANIQPGYYVLRHEIIALHSANNANGAQNYPFCIDLKITGSGTVDPCAAGADCRVGTKFYNEDDPGILIDIYSPISSYQLPGPAVWTGGAGSGSAPASSSVAAAPTSSAAPTTMKTSTKPMTTAAPTTSTTSKAAAPTTSSASSGSCAAKYAQCGGQGWTGATCCASGSTCKASGQYYSQCL